MRRNLRLKYCVGIGIISLAYWMLIFPNLFWQANQILLSDTGDGISSYYNTAYHIDHDNSFLEFKGNNYPYGEHLIYSVNNPLLTSILKGIGTFLPGIGKFAVGFINIAILFSLILAPVFIFLVLGYFGKNILVLGIGSLVISLLAPQIGRITGHYSLAYPSIIPFSLWLLFYYFIENRRPIVFWGIFLNSLLLLFVHVYLGVIVILFMMGFYFFLLHLNFKGIGKFKGFVSKILVHGVLPLLLFFLFMAFTDQHTGRTENPSGLGAYSSSLRSIFVSVFPPLKNLFAFIQPDRTEGYWEGIAYVGILTPFLLLASIFVHRLNKLSVNPIGGISFNLKLSMYKSWIFSSILLLVYSFGLPNKFGWEFLNKAIPFHDEFRSIGRFAIPFFYAATGIALLFIDRLFSFFRSKDRAITGYIALIIFCGVFLYEGFGYNRSLISHLPKTPNFFLYDQCPDEIKNVVQVVDSMGVDAIIGLPFYYKGSGNYTIEPSNNDLLNCQLISYHLGKPMFNTYLARTSICENRSVLSLFSPYIDSESNLIQNLGIDKKIAIIANGELPEEQKGFLKKSTFIKEIDSFRIYSILAKDIVENNSTMIIQPEDFEKTEKIIIYDSFNQFPSETTLKGLGSYYSHGDEYVRIRSVEGGKFTNTQRYIAKIWFYSDGYNCGQDALKAVFFVESHKNDTNEWIANKEVDQSLNIFNNWTEVKCEFSLSKRVDSVRFYVKDLDLMSPIVVDEFMVYKE